MLWLALYLFFGAKTTFWIFLVFPSLSLSQHWSRKPMDSPYPNHLSMVCIYLHLPLKSPSSIGEYTINGWYGIDGYLANSAAQLSGIEAFLSGTWVCSTWEQPSCICLVGGFKLPEKNGHHLVTITGRDRNRTSTKPTNQLGMSQNIRKQMAFIMAPGWKNGYPNFQPTSDRGLNHVDN